MGKIYDEVIGTKLNLSDMINGTLKNKLRQGPWGFLDHEHHERQTKTVLVSLGTFIYNRADSSFLASLKQKDQFMRFCAKLEKQDNLMSSDIAQAILNHLQLPFVGNYSELTTIIDNWKTGHHG